MPVTDRELSVRQYVLMLLIVASVAVVLRAAFQPADPPANAPIGITWHDEGVWAHNARNRALVGAWRLDEWNPMFVSPVFTLLEYVSFATLGVGWRQARLVSELAGVLSVVLIGIGVTRVAGRAAGTIAAALLATNYIYVMYNRVALLEATMIAALVASWCAYACAARRPMLGLVAGAAAIIAMLSKASAAFFLVAIGLDALVSVILSNRSSRSDADKAHSAAGWYALAGLFAFGVLALAVFVVPNWREYRLYNLEIYGARRSALGLRSLMDRASWFPIIHDFFTRQWPLTLLGTAGALSILLRWREVAPAERVLMFWAGLGSAELVIHDLGNERRFVFLIPALVASAAILLARDRRLLPSTVTTLTRSRALLAAPLVLYALYVIFGAIVRLPFLYAVRPGVRLSAALAVTSGLAIYATWPRVPGWMARHQWSAAVSLVLVGLLLAGDLAQFAQWAGSRTYRNYEASRAVGFLLPPGTLVQGKLANGLALENQIHPLYIGPGFGNYADRLRRHDVRYVLTYVAPRLGYEGPVINEVLEASPGWRIVRQFDVTETPGGANRAALIDKFGTRTEDRARD